MSGEILLKDNGIENQLDKIDKKGNSVSKSIGSAFGAIGKASLVAGTAIVAGLGWAMAEGVKGVVAMEDQTAQLNAVLKSTEGAVGLTSKEISGMATALQLTTKFAEEDTLAGQNMLLTFTNIGKDVFPQATTTLLDLATAMGTDAKSGAIQLGKALNDPEKGITALTRVGVTFTDEQKKSIKAMQESGDMAGAQTVILKELEKEFGGSAKAAGETFSGKLVILKNSLGELTEGFATGFIPYLQKFMDWVSSNMPTIQAVMKKAFDVIGDVLKVAGDFITNTLIPALKKLWDWIEPNIPLIKDTIKTAFDISTDAIKKTIKVLGDIINWCVKYKDILIPLVAGIAAGAVAFGIITLAIEACTIAAGIFAFITSPIGLVVIAIGLLVAAAVLLYKNWDTVTAFLKNIWKSIAQTATNVFNGIKDFLSGLWTGIKTTAVNAFNGLKNGISSILSTLGSVISNGFNSAISFITSLPGKALQWGKDFINGLKNGIMSAINGIVNAVSSIASKIRGFLHFSTPDEGPLADYESWMPDFMGGLAKGIENSKYLVANAVKGLSSDVSIGMNLTPSMAGINNSGGTTSRVTPLSGNPTGTANIYIELDGYTIAKVIAQPLTDIIRLKTGLAF